MRAGEALGDDGLLSLVGDFVGGGCMEWDVRAVGLGGSLGLVS